MSLALATFGLASSLFVAPTAPTMMTPPERLTPEAARVVLLSASGPSAPLDDAEIIFYFAEPSPSEGSIITTADPLGYDDAALPCPLHATLRSLGRWLLVLLSMVFVAALLGSVGATRRPLPLAAIAVRQPARPVPLVERLLVLACLWSPMLMLLGLLQAEREMLSSVLLCMAATGIVASGVMLASRRRLAQRLRWALEGRLDGQPDGVVVKAEIDAKKLVSPPGDPGPTPWYRADLMVESSDEPARVALDGVVVDDDAARALVRMAMGLPAQTRLTVLGCATRAPADAHGANPLERRAPTQARISGTEGVRTLLVGGDPATLERRLRSECLLLLGAFLGSISAAFLTMF
jgi:hypothetical protein